MEKRSITNLQVRLLLGLLLFASVLPTSGTQAQTSQRCFVETGLCIEGRIREFWEQNGGLSAFGLPITPQQEQLVEGQPRQVQWFERNRLELHPESQRPYDVLLGRLGVDQLSSQGRDWFQFPKSTPQTGCEFFAQTGHNICGAILSTWRAGGLEFDRKRGKSAEESLALFGLPISDAQTEMVAGHEYTVQWFERARFELHPENAPPYNVLLVLLGRESDSDACGPAVVPGPGIWVSREELSRLPMAGPAWAQLKATADGDLGKADIANQDSNHDLRTLAAALVYARTCDQSYRAKAADAVMAAIETENNDRTLALGRNLVSYVLAADLIDQIARKGPARRVDLFAGFRTEDQIYDRADLQRLEQEHPWLTVTLAVSEDKISGLEHGDIGDVLMRHGPWNSREICVAGPAVMVEDTVSRLIGSGVPTQRISSEVFAPSRPGPSVDGEVTE